MSNFKLDYGTYLQMEKYVHLEDAIEEVCPEILEDTEVRVLKDKLHWANYNLRKKIERMVDFDGV